MRFRLTAFLRLVFLAFCIVSVSGMPTSAEQQFQSRQSVLYEKVHPSIVFLRALSNDGKSYAFCTGSVVSSNGNSSIIMTAAHCVAGNKQFTAYLHEDLAHPHNATPVAAGTPNGSDVAFLKIGVGNLQTLAIAGSVEVGANVMIIGYPVAALTDLQMRNILVPRLDTTVIASVVPRANGQPQQVNYSFQATDHGDSGAPVIEVECGCVVGVVHGEYGENMGRNDYAMGPVEIVAIAGQSSQIALHKIGKFAPNPGPIAVGYLPATRSTPEPRVPNPSHPTPAPNGPGGVETLSTIPGPSKDPQWTGWGKPIALREAAGVSANVRCLTIGRESLWQVQAINESDREVEFRHRLTDANGNAFDQPIAHALPNDGAYLFRPQQLNVGCNGTVYHQVIDVSFEGQPKTPDRENLTETNGGPTLKFNAWTKFVQSKSLQGVQVAFRCIDLGDRWYGWEIAFANQSGHPYTFDFDVEVGSDPNYRHRYYLPADETIRYSDVMSVSSGSDCSKSATMWAKVAS